ncbi:hypothetical protein BDK51DRAFT_49858 [Blyttiomyces helicus]|uniref:F-box domain-containing protein n=1 Tax=Blyttiomyces helicus TaxID=388810 RepID=A0A4P9VXW3_9FUNG|nr:hypothetical protein BDK51DRAFT_49858 [Blyttiomyces helicus]|eukprot:RKO83563.1 hypothetical protein BDK51DRAFT_49858 [Blyttiomyces helicus]
MILFGKHFTKLIAEAHSLLGLGYALALAGFMALFYTGPFLAVLLMYFILDVLGLITRSSTWGIDQLRFIPESISNLTAPPTTTTTAPPRRRLLTPSQPPNPSRPTYTRLVRDIRFRGSEALSRGLMNPWASHLFLLSSCCPNLSRLHLLRCSLAWWFRLAPLPNLKELVLEKCELDDAGIEIVAAACRGLEGLHLRGCEVRVGDEAGSGGGGGGVTTTFAKLHTLSLHACAAAVDVDGLRMILDRSPTLAAVRFAGCAALERSVLAAGARHCGVGGVGWGDGRRAVAGAEWEDGEGDGGEGAMKAAAAAVGVGEGEGGEAVGWVVEGGKLREVCDRWAESR